jgi:outer membrane protein W
MKKPLMKFLVLTTFLAMSLPFQSMAQKRGGDKVWSFGPEAGVNFAKLGRDANNTNFKPGMLLGGFLTYSIRNTYAFTGKVLYSQKGYQTDNFKETLKYIEVPVVVRLFFNRNGAFRPNLFAGPSFGFLTGVSTKTGNASEVKMTNYDSVFNTFDVGLTGGLGLNYEIAKEIRLLLDVRYTHGITDITKAGNSNVNNQAIGITGGISFGI